MEKITCKNCGTEYEGKYCNECGQKASVRKLTWRSLGENILASLTNVERGFFFTIGQLFTRPGHMMRDYLEGKRANYFKPFSMLFLLVGAYAVMATVIFPEETYAEARQKQEIKALQKKEKEGGGKNPESLVLPNSLPADSVHTYYKGRYDNDDDGWFGEIISDLVKDLDGNSDHAVFKFLGNVINSPLFVALFFLLSFIINVKWMFWKRAKGYNLVEFFFTGAYIASQILVFLLIFRPLDYYWLDSALIYSLAFVGLVAWDYKQFFRIRWWWAIGKTILLYLLSFVVMLLLIILFALLIIGLAHLLNG